MNLLLGKMRFGPFLDQRGIPASAVREVAEYFIECGGNIDALTERLNDYAAEPSRRVSANDLLSSQDRWFGAEFYFYFIMTTKEIIGRDDFSVAEKGVRTISGGHRIYERGPVGFPPWHPRTGNHGENGFSVINVRIPLVYLRNRGENPQRLLDWLNAFLPESERRDERFFDIDFFRMSVETSLLFLSLFEALRNDPAEIMEAYYQNSRTPDISVWAQFLGTYKVDTFETIIKMRKMAAQPFQERIERRGRTVRWEIRIAPDALVTQARPYERSGYELTRYSAQGVCRSMLERISGKTVTLESMQEIWSPPREFGLLFVFKIHRTLPPAAIYALVELAVIAAAIFCRVYPPHGSAANAAAFFFGLAAALFPAAVLVAKYARLKLKLKSTGLIVQRQFTAIRDELDRGAAGDAMNVVGLHGDFEDRIRALELSPRENEICDFLMRGLSSKEIADRMNLSPRTVENRLQSLYEKLGIHSRTEFVARLYERAQESPDGRGTREDIANDTHRESSFIDRG